MTENTEAKAEEKQQEQQTKEQQERTETENLFHKIYLFGLGLQKDLEETINNLIERGETASEEKQKIVDDFVKKAKESTGSFEKKIEELISSTIESMNFATKEKHDKLEKRVCILESKILEMENRINELHPKE